MKIYRIMAMTTNSSQPSSETYWNKQVLYCGYDRLEAIRVYHESTPLDYWCGYGNRCRKTVAQSKAVECQTA